MDFTKRLLVGCGVAAGTAVSLVLLLFLLGGIFGASGRVVLRHLPLFSANPPHIVDAARKQHRILSEVEGIGNADTATFFLVSRSRLVYQYDCTDVGGSGVFSVTIVGKSVSPTVQEWGNKGGGVRYENVRGSAHLAISSNCQWRIWSLAE